MIARAAWIALVSLSAAWPARAALELDAPRVAFTGTEVRLVLRDPALGTGEMRAMELEAGAVAERVRLIGPDPIERTVAAAALRDVRIDGTRFPLDVRVFPGWITLLPPLIAIGTALAARQVVPALLAGVFVGALFLARFDVFDAFSRTLERYVVGSLANDPDHVTIIFIASILGGMSGVIQRSGGARAIADRLTRGARSARTGQLATWGAGLVVFFDDYANTLIVGNTMRPLTDRLRISREKLSFLVDATSAPVASLAPISTWIGFEVGLLADALSGVGSERDAYGLFLASIPYRFYPLFLLLAGFAIAWTGRDLGAMHRAEARARRGEGLWREGAELLTREEAPSASETTPRASAASALVPIVLVILVTLGGILATGASAGGPSTLRGLFGAGDSYRALLWAGAVGSIAAVLLARLLGGLAFGRAVMAWVEGVRAMVLAVVILVLAWAIGAVCAEMGTADVLVGYLADRFPAVLLPASVFVLSALVSFSTGTSWGTMAILVPIVVPLGFTLGGGSEAILVGSVSGVLAGSVFGDHCSPISDTTVLSSLASGADHVDHVRTQLPYALLCGGVGIALGDLPSALGVPVWICLVAGGAAVVLVIRLAGRRSEPVG